MSQSGPSREELENYFKNSRPYFDELAKHYYETDRAYYNQYIAPFYSPFASIVPGKKGAGSKIILLAAMIFLAVMGAAVAFFVALETESPEKQKQIEDVREKTDKETNRKTNPRDTASVKKKNLSDYEKGIEYYESGDYENAEMYFKKVPVTDKNYGDAQQKIVEMKVEKMTGKYKRYIKPAPRERKR